MSYKIQRRSSRSQSELVFFRRVRTTCHPKLVPDEAIIVNSAKEKLAGVEKVTEI